MESSKQQINGILKTERKILGITKKEIILNNILTPRQIYETEKNEISKKRGFFKYLLFIRTNHYDLNVMFDEISENSEIPNYYIKVAVPNDKLPYKQKIGNILKSISIKLGFKSKDIVEQKILSLPSLTTIYRIDTVINSSNTILKYITMLRVNGSDINALFDKIIANK